MNDIFIINKKITKYRKRVRQILKKLQKIGLQIKQNKCEFEKLEIKILERIINKEKIKSSPEHLQTIKK